jgi:hypothetical protein
MGIAQPAHPSVVRISDRAQAELRPGEALVFDWTSLAFCCAVAGEVSLRPTTLQEAQRSSAYVPLSSGDSPLVVAHRRAYPMLVGATSRSTADAAWASARFPPRCHPTSGCGRRSDEPGHRPRDRREIPASDADAPPITLHVRASPASSRRRSPHAGAALGPRTPMERGARRRLGAAAWSTVRATLRLTGPSDPHSWPAHCPGQGSSSSRPWERWLSAWRSSSRVRNPNSVEAVSLSRKALGPAAR